MNKNILKIWGFIALIMATMACSPEEPRPLEEAASRAELLTGTWQINQAIQVDENAKFKGFPAEVTYKDITNILPEHPYTDFAITFNANGSYAVAKGRSLVQVPDTEGTWALDDDTYSSAVLLKGANGDEMQLDIIDIEGLRYAEPATRTIQLGLVRYLDGKAFLSYLYHMV